MGLFGKIFGGGSSSFGPLLLRVIEKDFNDTTGFVVQCRGTIPVYSRKNIGFVVSLMCTDNDGKLNPVISFVEQAQEEETTAYQHIHEIGVVEGPGGYDDWAGIAPIIPDLIHPAYGGTQKIDVVVRLVDMNDRPSIFLGFSDSPDFIWTGSAEFTFDFEIKGYKEAREDKKEARALSIKIGVAVSMSDGELDDREGEALNKWIKKIISPYDEDEQESLKKIYNNALKESYKLAESGNLNLTEICKEMNKIAEIPQKHEALELAHQIMIADGLIDKSETEMINKIATLLEIDPKELENIRDKQLVSFKPTDDDDSSGPGGASTDVESLLGIDTTWSNKKIRAHLGKEFAKWNGRLNTLPEGQERDYAQFMLNLIAVARKKYAE